ncbi:MAG TPA: efflux transporter periplasmic adaptor subunit, partial [Polyangia bacterium]|nr:efflux transporter periplasmic adaptor subunit [Polyangia bacterium]
ARVPVGMPVRIGLPANATEAPLAGKIAAVDPNIDPVTRAAKLRASIADEKAVRDKLRPGMFVNVSVVLPEQTNVVSVPATAVLRAPYGNSVFIVEDRKDEQGKPVSGPDGKPAKVARQQFVRVGSSRGDFVAIDEGVKPGQEVVMLGGFKLRNGAPVMVNNGNQLSPSQNPSPPNR